MSEKLDWFPIDTSIFPIDFSFKLPTSRWVRIALYCEFCLAILAVIGTLILTILPNPKVYQTSNQNISAPSPDTIPK
ncbi:MAG: hypothetical protein V1858_00565 [Candidatus Gottesmanbacteria bacterium]